MNSRTTVVTSDQVQRACNSARTAQDFADAAYELGVDPGNIIVKDNQTTVRVGRKSFTFTNARGRDLSKGYRAMIVKGLLALFTGLGLFVAFVLPHLHLGF